MTKLNKSASSLMLYVVLALGAVVMFVPFYWMIITSLKTGAKILEMPPTWIPDPITLENYITAWTKVDFARYTLNSGIVVVLDVVGMLLSCAMVGFGLAMFQFRLKTTIYMAMLATLILPSQVTLIPTYFIWKQFQAFDTFFPLFVPSFLGKAFGIFLLHQFFKSLPKEFFQAALMDGYRPWGILWKIYVPLAKPALSALAVFTFINSWSDTIGPLLYLQSRSLYTLPLGLLYLRSQTDVFDTPILMAGAFITTIPVIIVFLFAQRQFVEGVAASGVKG